MPFKMISVMDKKALKIQLATYHDLKILFLTRGLVEEHFAKESIFHHLVCFQCLQFFSSKVT